MSSEIKLNIDAETVKEEKYKDWEIEDAARTIMRAEEIKQDEELMKLDGWYAEQYKIQEMGDE